MNVESRAPARPARRGFALIAVLALFALVAGLVSILTLHTGQLVRANHSRTTDIELRQMIDSGVSYARLHRTSWPKDPAEVTLDATALTHGDRTAEITLQPTVDQHNEVTGATVSATIRLPRKRSRSRTILVTFPVD